MQSERKEHRRSNFNPFTEAALLIALYFIGGVVGRLGSFMAGSVALVWPPAGIAIAAIVIFGYRFWPVVTGGAVVFAIASGKPINIFTFTGAIGTTMSAVTCAYLLEATGFRRSMDRLRDGIAFIVFGSVMSTAINALCNVVGRYYSQHLEWNDLFPAVLACWVPNALGSLLVTPLLLAWTSPSKIEWNKKRFLELGACAAALLVSCSISFDTWVFHGLRNYPMAFLPFPFLVWAALRFEQRGGTTAVAVVAACAIAELLQSRGPFYTGTDNTSLVLIGAYIGVASCLTLLLAGAAMERDEAHRLVAASQKQYRAVVEDQFDLICRFLPDGTISFVNDAYCRFFNKTPAQLLGANFFGDLCENNQEMPLAVLRALTPERDHISFDNATYVDDAVLWQQVSVRAFFDASGKITEFQAVMQDVTARKEYAERLKAIFDNMLVGIIAVTPPGRVVAINPAAERIFGRQSAKVLGQPVNTLFSAADAALYDERMSRPVEAGETRYMELGALTPTKTVVPIELAVTDTTVGRSHLQIIVVRDISDRKQLELQFQKLDAIGRFSGDLAHDFNNVSQAVLGYTELLLQRMSEADKNRETVARIQQSAEHTDFLTRKLLGLRRKRVVQRKSIALNTVLTEAQPVLHRILGDTVTLNVSATDTSTLICADAPQLQQVLINLALNARDAGTTDFKVSSTMAEVNETHPIARKLHLGNYALLTVEDTGCGMYPELMARIFEPFFSTKAPGQATGLGLSVVQNIIQLCGGEITVESTPGRGSVFSIYLPLAPTPTGDQTVTYTGPIEPKPKTIVLVEDEEVIRTAIVTALSAKGYNVLAAADGLEGLALTRKHDGEIDLIITDLMMPELTGWQLIDRVAKSHSNLPTLFISGFVRHEILAQTRSGVAFLGKPFTNDVLLAKVEEMLNPKPAPTTDERALAFSS